MKLLAIDGNSIINRACSARPAAPCRFLIVLRVHPAQDFAALRRQQRSAAGDGKHRPAALPEAHELTGVCFSPKKSRRRAGSGPWPSEPSSFASASARTLCSPDARLPGERSTAFAISRGFMEINRIKRPAPYMADILQIIRRLPVKNAVEIEHPGRNMVTVPIDAVRDRHEVSQQGPGVSDQQKPRRHQRNSPFPHSPFPPVSGPFPHRLPRLFSVSEANSSTATDAFPSQVHLFQCLFHSKKQ